MNSQSGRAEPHSLIRDAIMGGFYTGHHTIYTDVYIHIYTLFSTLFRTKFQPLRSHFIQRWTHHSTNDHPSSIATKKKIFPQISTQIHNFSQDFTIKNHQKHQNPQKPEKPEKTVFLGVPPHPPKNPYFPGFSGPPKLHKFAQICTNLHQFAPPKHHFWGYPICRDPLDRPC